MNYDKYPTIKYDAESSSVLRGWDEIVKKLSASVGKRGKCVIAVETYPGVDDAEVAAAVRSLDPDLWVDTRSVLLPEERIREAIAPIITDDRVFGRMYFGELRDFQDPERLRAAEDVISGADGLTVVYGFGASQIADPDVVVYADMARWEIQMRFRRGAPNYLTSNGDEDVLRKFKQGYFLEWRLADRIKRRLFDRIDFYLDTNRAGDPVMITGDVLRGALESAAKRPFRTVPYFDPGVWGGQWMKKVCGLDPDAKNYAWCFDGVPEENSLYFEINGVRVEVPASDLVFYRPKELLGPRVFARYGAEFPIRFDFLDTMGGQNLSLQVHPTTDYIRDKFGMSYTQDESYYILDAEEDACVYLGVKEGVDEREMLEALREAKEGGKPFDGEKYVNRFPAKKHDHFLIPAGTVHCSGKNCMVLEVSATPYIFTFKLWDWGRLGLDGKPRPIHLEHGERVIQWDRRTEWVRNNLVDRAVIEETCDGFSVEKTGLHELEPIETKRYTVAGTLQLDTEDTVNVLNLVEGVSAVIESPTGSFAPFEVHYAETFIVPAAVGEYTVRPTCVGGIKLLRATVKQ
ncbi:MAG: class I mannose-6-phosphate isomerase [Clostridia bacterium]|nr:class I mannose-6-phosphate isomerase [Clostridia bacterium]